MINLKNRNNQLTKWLSDNIILVYLTFLLLILITPFLLTRNNLFGFGLGTSAHEIGDAINRLTAPIIGAFLLLLVYLAFKSQLDANEKLNIANEKLLTISERQLYTAEFTIFKEKLEFIKENYNLNFLFDFSKKTSNWKKATTTTEITNLNYQVKNYLEKFKDYKRTEMQSAIKILSIYSQQLLKSTLSEDNKGVLGIECNELINIKNNIDSYKIASEVRTQFLTGGKPNFLLEKYDFVIALIDKDYLKTNGHQLNLIS